MRDMLKSQASLRLCASLAAAGLAMAGAPALAQTTVEEVVVIGSIGPDGEPRTLSRAVSYRDLDITTEAGQAELKRRVNDTASELCEQLDESDTSSVVVPSCKDAAVRDAMEQTRIHIAAATPRGPAWTPMPMTAALPAPVAPAATTYAAPASVTVRTITNGPVPDTPENRRKYGGPMSSAGKRTAPVGN
jgi:UrcA family protein